MRGVHGEKIVAAIDSDKMPEVDIERLQAALRVYDQWICDLNNSEADTLDELIIKMVELLDNYKYYIDFELIFGSPEDFLYRQKGQLKLDNTVIEEFLPIFVKKCIKREYGDYDIEISSQMQTFSSAFFATSLSNPAVGGGISIKTKAQDFSMSRTLYLKSSYNPLFSEPDTVTVETHLGYVLAEIKTNLDKTMFQEASATAHDIKQAVTGAKYYLLCDFLDMTPISTTTTDIDEIIILRKAKRIGSNTRKHFSSNSGRNEYRNWYSDYLKSHPYSADMFKRFITHIFSQLRNEDLIEASVLEEGYF